MSTIIAVALVVDDDRETNQFVSYILKNNYGLRVLSIFRGTDATYQLTHQSRIDYLISANGTTDMSGAELIRLAKDSDRYTHSGIKTMLLSSSPLVEMVARNCGADSYCRKPVTFAIFNRRFSEMMSLQLRQAI